MSHQIDRKSADAIEFYLIANGYVDMDRKVTDKYRTDVQMNTLSPLPADLQPIADGIHTLVQAVYDDSVLDSMIEDGHKAKIQDNDLNENFYKKNSRLCGAISIISMPMPLTSTATNWIEKAIKHIDEKLFVAELQYTTTTGTQRESIDKTDVATRAHSALKNKNADPETRRNKQNQI